LLAIWTAYQRGEHVIIVDPQGRSRMRAKGMLNLAILTACLIDDKGPMPEEPNADSCLKREVQDFINQTGFYEEKTGQ
jgi:hypothetical protein